jgi:hypothetical protein
MLGLPTEPEVDEEPSTRTKTKVRPSVVYPNRCNELSADWRGVEAAGREGGTVRAAQPTSAVTAAESETSGAWAILCRHSSTDKRTSACVHS